MSGALFLDDEVIDANFEFNETEYGYAVGCMACNEHTSGTQDSTELWAYQHISTHLKLDGTVGW